MLDVILNSSNFSWIFFAVVFFGVVAFLAILRRVETLRIYDRYPESEITPLPL